MFSFPPILLLLFLNFLSPPLSCYSSVMGRMKENADRMLLATAWRERRSKRSCGHLWLLCCVAQALMSALARALSHREGRTDGYLGQLPGPPATCHASTVKGNKSQLCPPHTKLPFLPFLGPQNRRRENFTHISHSRMAFYLRPGNLMVEQQGQAKLKWPSILDEIVSIPGESTEML